jgi:hypothetical protein
MAKAKEKKVKHKSVITDTSFAFLKKLYQHRISRWLLKVAGKKFGSSI